MSRKAIINQSIFEWTNIPLFGKEGLGEIFRRCLYNYGLLSKRTLKNSFSFSDSTDIPFINAF